MGAPRKEERVDKHVRIIKKYLDYFEEKNIKINPWIDEQMKIFIEKSKK